MATLTGTHTAVVVRALGGPPEAISVPTPSPGPGEVLVRIAWASPTPFDTWQTDFGLAVQSWPVFLGGSSVGTVVAVGEGVVTLQVGDKVFGFSHGPPKVKAFQEYAVLETRRLGKLPSTLSPQSAAVIPGNFVTAWWSFTHYLNLTIPFELPAATPPPAHDQPILIWGGGTSVGQYAIQLLKLAGYTNVIATASSRHGALLESYGARVVLPYSDPAISSLILSAAGGQPIKSVLDCVVHDKKTIALYKDVLGESAQVAALLPLQVSDDSGKVVSVESPDDLGSLFSAGVHATGVRTHFYHEDEVLYKRLQPEVMPRLFAEGLIKPNPIRVIERASLLERVGESLQLLRDGVVSGEKLVFAVAE